MTNREARQQFTAAIQRANRAPDDDDFALDEMALLIAAEEYPTLRVTEYLTQLDELAAQARANDEPHATPITRLIRFNELFAGAWGFRGNQENYFDARNSFLNEVIERRTGIPITLSIIYLEVARHIGLRLHGVGLPGHFILKYTDETEEILVDPFHGGRLLSEEDCFRLLLEMFQGRVVFERSLLATVTKRQILVRMLQNLKGIYARANDHHKTLSILERILLLTPEAHAERRDYGFVCGALGRLNQGIQALTAYLAAVPKASDADAVKERLKELKQRQAALN